MELTGKNCFRTFTTDISGISLPERFTFPFYYEPHPLSLIAANELQRHLDSLKDLDHNFGIEEGKEGIVIGKMFGILVVQTNSGELGYLAAFSGKLANSNHHEGFVPPVFDILEEDGIFRKGEAVVSRLNLELETLERDEDYLQLKSAFENEQTLSEKKINDFREFKIEAKRARKVRREEARPQMSDEEYEDLLEILKKESIRYQWELKQLILTENEALKKIRDKLSKYEERINELKEERKYRSSKLQQELFDQYYFLNKEGEKKSLGSIFYSTSQQQPPAGAGECAAPKLLHYAFANGLKPIAMAEFWWGASPKSEVRKHRQFYPACRGKCEPILGHMLQGIEMDENPMQVNPAEGKELEIVYEDDQLMVINKPAEFLSVPGKEIADSVYSRIRERLPDATGPLIVHRLDMSTSGIMLIAKSKAVHKQLQSQFLKRSVKKRYVALLEGLVNGEEGTIELPLRVDLDDRPRQLVCYEYGKPAETKWEVIERADGRTRVRFYPITGRTHQLRVHSAHSSGLNLPIVGDDLYGTKSDRLHLHAEFIEFVHPVTRETIQFQVNPEF